MSAQQKVKPKPKSGISAVIPTNSLHPSVLQFCFRKANMESRSLVLSQHAKMPTRWHFRIHSLAINAINSFKSIFGAVYRFPFAIWNQTAASETPALPYCLPPPSLGFCRKRPLGNTLQPLTDVGNARKKEKRANILITYPPYSAM